MPSLNSGQADALRSCPLNCFLPTCEPRLRDLPEVEVRLRLAAEKVRKSLRQPPERTDAACDLTGTHLPTAGAERAEHVAAQTRTHDAGVNADDPERGLAERLQRRCREEVTAVGWHVLVRADELHRPVVTTGDTARRQLLARVDDRPVRRMYRRSRLGPLQQINEVLCRSDIAGKIPMLTERLDAIPESEGALLPVLDLLRRSEDVVEPVVVDTVERHVRRQLEMQTERLGDIAVNPAWVTQDKCFAFGPVQARRASARPRGV